jgi:RNA polymerase-binding transcription factor DksA
MDTTPFKVRLEEHLARLTAELSAIASHDAHTDDWEALPVGADQAEPDQNDEADVVEEWNERRAVVAALEMEYHDVKRALRKMSEGTYGICEVSGEPIEVERLEINPAARTCIAHREEEELLAL